ncbi:multidrug ABC transporter ATP-binding protein [Pseudoalteromonas luteoviolacea]|uniref:Multidrug ABC transporter ATP-binding protein n=1 Tax=Pseudoalteromonas luteoviolacea TaxID=43657 RepID=A0A1C0TPF9_9GAMM|nr:ABC transporter ATP-binding protein [Pseudoalteromonas luteoviolacea]OCQ20814.1 multidrug ABC transporter ATP-binding protein [Pseudoalteromonas luteoviolacea]
MLKVCNLSKSYKGSLALNNINLTIKKGMFGLLGPNGAGKSSLMRSIATLQSADSGYIEYDGICVSAHAHEVRRRLGYLPQDFGVYPNISAIRLLDHLAALKGFANKSQRKEAVSSLLIKTNLYEQRKRAVSTFSGGMKQRFGIAQALLGDPDLIIVDEPTAGLDPQERNRFYNLLCELSEDKVVVLSTHIVEDVSELCTECAIMNRGEIVLQGSPANLISSLSGQVWRGVVAKETLSQVEQSYNVISKKRFAGEIIASVVQDEQPEGFLPATVDLEDVYFATLAQAKIQ